MTARPSLLEVLGLHPLGERLGQAALALRGNPYTPASRFGPSSLRIFRPRLALAAWLGVRPRDRLVPIYNLFNHLRPPPAEGWSVRVTRVRDFRGRRLTYDSHNGTDFAVPPGTTVVAAAPGRVVRISSEFDRGGLKVFIDHGHGLMTTSNHLSRALVSVGRSVARAEPIALSGMSGIDGVAAFPWNAPHVHFNVWLNGDYVDPFAVEGETSLWRSGGLPVPHLGPSEGDYQATPWDEAAVAAAIEACRHPAVRAALASIASLEERAVAVLFQRNYYPSRFTARPPLAREVHSRAQWLDLPFLAMDYSGVRFPD